MDPSSKSATNGSSGQGKRTYRSGDNKDEDNDGWTMDHHLIVGKQTWQRSWLYPTGRPEDSSTTYEVRPLTLTAQWFQPEIVRTRKPALWRGTVAPPVTTTTAAAAASSWAAAPTSSRRNASNNSGTPAMLYAMDCVAPDWQGTDNSKSGSEMVPTTSSSRAVMVVPNPTAVSRAKERYQSVLYQQVVSQYLPSLVVAAVMEECQAQFLEQHHNMLLAASASATTTATASSAIGSNHNDSLTVLFDWTSTQPARYYRQNPTAYLVAPARGGITTVPGSSSSNKDKVESSGSIAQLPFSFTPSQLVNRIKHGCSLAWSEYQRRNEVMQQHHQHLHNNNHSVVVHGDSSTDTTPATGTAAAALLSDRRRSSNRLARQQTHHEAAISTSSTSAAAGVGTATLLLSSSIDPTLSWKVTAGGRVAHFLKENLYDDDINPSAQKQPPSENRPISLETLPTADNETRQLPDPTHQPPQSVPSDINGPELGMKPEAVVSDDVLMGEKQVEDSNGEPNHKTDCHYNPPHNHNKVEAEKYGVQKHENEDDVQDDPDGTAIATSSAAPKAEEISGHCDNEEDEEIDIVNDSNPYLTPTAPAVLEWLGRKSTKLLTSLDLQGIFPSLLYRKRKRKPASKGPTTPTPGATPLAQEGVMAANFLSKTDRVILGRMLPQQGADLLLGPGARLMLQLVNDEQQPQDIQHWELSSFGRSQFTLCIRNARAGAEVRRRALDEYAIAEHEYNERKAWDTWRYKGIHGGYCVWPSWLDAVRHWRAAQVMTEVLATNEPHPPPPPPAMSTPGANQDAVLAKVLSDQETSYQLGGGMRRTTRRAAGDGGAIFYGGQSNVTQKQLMDTILRFVSQQSYHTQMGLVSAIPDESTDPLRRMRSALGKLVWKRNQLACMSVRTEWSDRACWKTMQDGFLTNLQQEVENTTDKDSNDQILAAYIRDLHQTELQLRSLVMKHLLDMPVWIIATAADERPGSMECIDHTDFSDPSSLDWHSTGNALLGKIIYRPHVTWYSDNAATCRWYRVTGFTEALAADGADVEGGSNTERPSIGLAKEPTAVKRRIRFQAVATPSPGQQDVDTDVRSVDDPLILTEAQVHAGVKAAEVQLSQASKSRPDSNPFAGTIESQVCLIPQESGNSEQISGTVAGHTSVLLDDAMVKHMVLVLPGQVHGSETGFWAELDVPASGPINCYLEGNSCRYTVQQFDYHPSSTAFQECQNIVTFLHRHPKAGPFMEPVDPVALNIPDYFEIIKHPMDLSTLSENLEAGVYSNIPPSEAQGRTSIARMLNGPFRRDLELIFDNAMYFNPPDDWIHMAASTIKKAALKKIDQATLSAEQKEGGHSQDKRSVYVDYDSDVDMYTYESDPDEDFEAAHSSSRKRKATGRPPSKEESSSRAVKRPVRLQKVLSESLGLRPPLSNVPLRTDASVFSLPLNWNCRWKGSSNEASALDKIQVDTELDELIALHRELGEKEVSGLRRSTRAHGQETSGGEEGGGKAMFSGSVLEYFDHVALSHHSERLPTSRFEVEVLREHLHESYYAKSYNENQKWIQARDGASIGIYANGSFPPYLGRVIPVGGEYPSSSSSSEPPLAPLSGQNLQWEIRDPFVIPALRWIIRGLVHSEHLHEVEPLESENAAVLPNDVFYIDPQQEPFDIVDIKEFARRKKLDVSGTTGQEEEVELSEYEKMRAERVARNAERLKALGLA